MAFDDLYRMSCHAVITNPQQQVLLLKATYATQAWGLPGGAIDPGETIHQCLHRECKEELSCEIEISYLSGVYYHSAVNSHVFIFRCELATPDSIQLSTEHSAWQWFALEQLTAVQRIRIEDCLNFSGTVFSRNF